MPRSQINIKYTSHLVLSAYESKTNLMIGDEPTPKDHEIMAAEAICREMRDIAKKLPVPAVRTDGKENQKFRQFGNNFYIIFLELNRKNKKIESDQTKVSFSEGIFLGKAEKLGGRWKRFLADYAVLVEKIAAVLERQEMFLELKKRSTALNKNPKNYELHDKICAEINLEGIHADILGELNPLLMQASAAMIECGIKPEELEVLYK